MNHLKMLGFAMLVTTALAAFAGTSTASATTLCRTGGFPESGCGAGKGEINAASDNLELTSTNSVFKNSVSDVSCEDSEMTIDPATSTGAPVLAEVTKLAFHTKCETKSKQPCTVEVFNLPYPVTIEGSTLTIKDSVGAGARVKCGFLISCLFTTKEAPFMISNVLFTTITGTEIAFSRSGSLCPATASWNVTYSVTAPEGFTVK